MKALLLLLTLLFAQQGNRPEFGTIRGRLTTSGTTEEFASLVEWTGRNPKPTGFVALE